MKLRKIICAVICAATVLSCLAVGSSAADSDFVIEDGVLVDFKGPKNADIIIPDGVVEIKKGAFVPYWDFQIKSIYIPESVRVINGSISDQCTGITAIDVDPRNEHYCSVDGILFSKDMTNLISYPNGHSQESYIIPDSVTKITEYAFYASKNLKKVVIPDGIKEINSGTFYKCVNLNDVTIPDSVDLIEFNAFGACGSLESITLPKNLNFSPAGAFNQCHSLKEINIPSGSPTFISIDGVLFSKTRQFLVCYPRAKAGKYVVPHFVDTIGSYAFQDCRELTEIDLNNVVKIEAIAFNRCTGLTEVSIPDTVTSIGESAFSFCSSLSKIELPKNLTLIDSNCFHGCQKLTDISIPYSVTEISYRAFQGCKSLTDLFIHDSVKTMNESIFADKGENLTIHCYKGSVAEQYAIDNGIKYVSIEKPELLIENGVLVSYSGKGGDITIPDSVTTIGNSAFRDCTGLTSVTIPSTVTAIDDYAFWGCTALSSINIPDSVTSIGNRAFRDCTSLSQITLPDSLTYIGGYIFANCPDITVHCNEGTYAWQYAVDNGLIAPPVTTTVTTTAATTPPVVTEPAIIETTEVTVNTAETTEITETSAETTEITEILTTEPTKTVAHTSEITDTPDDEAKPHSIIPDVLIAVLIMGIAVLAGCAVLYVLNRRGIIDLQKKSSPDPEESEETEESNDTDE